MTAQLPPPRPGSFRVAVAQVAPILGDRAASTARVASCLVEAAGEGAELILFSEAQVPGSLPGPEMIRNSALDRATQDQLRTRFAHGAWSASGNPPASADLGELARLAREHSIHAVIGAIEWEGAGAGGRLYSAAVVLPVEGDALFWRRRATLSPSERTLLHAGDARGLEPFEVGGLRFGVVIGQEARSPVLRAALASKGVDVWLVLEGPGASERPELSTWLARDGVAYALLAAPFLRRADVPADLPNLEHWLRRDEVLLPGGSAIASPLGEQLHGPVCGREAILYGDLDPNRLVQARLAFDPFGFDARPDLFEARVLTPARRPAGQ